MKYFVKFFCQHVCDGWMLLVCFVYRKKVMDFYQRATLSSYCSAFSYQPMVESMANYFDDLYLELPRNNNRDSQLSDTEIQGVPGIGR